MSGELTIPALAIRAAQRWPDADAIIDGDRRLSFAQVAETMLNAAAAFVANGLEAGDRVALWAQNSADWIVACLGLQAAGGVLVPLNTRFKPGEAEFILRRAKCRMAVAATEFLDTRYAELVEGLALPDLRRVIRLGEGHWQQFLDSGDAAARVEAEARLADLSDESVSDIMFTSGTTGEPKGAMATHGQTVRTAHLWAGATTIREADRFLILWPFFHCSGYKAGWVVNLAVGATSIPAAVLEAPELLATVERESVTFLPGPPTLFQTLLSMPDRVATALKSVRVSITGASAVPPSLIVAMRDTLGIPVILTGYGLTETCGTATMTRPDDPPEIVTTSCGRAIEGVEIAIVDEDGNQMDAGAAGEILVRGMNVMRGYLDDTAATAEAVTAEGWLHTGDIGTLDEAGYLRITDRKKDVFIVGGFNCYPAEIEKAMMAHPAILQVAVTGVPDLRMGEVGKAFVVLKPGATCDEASLIAWGRERLANYKVPRSVDFVDALPTNATGKVQKFRLKP